MKYTHYLDTVALATDEVLVPQYLNLLQLLPLLLTSKQLRNKINARPCIAQHIRAMLGIPIERMRHPTKVLTFFQIRSGAKPFPFNILTEYGHAMKDACIICLKHSFVTCRSFEKGKDGKLLFTYGIEECQICNNLQPMGEWVLKRRLCKHPSHFRSDKRLHNQRICRECFVVANAM